MLPRRFLLVFVVSTMRCSDAPTAHADVAASPSAYAAQTPSESVLTVKTEPPGAALVAPPPPLRSRCGATSPSIAFDPAHPPRPGGVAGRAQLAELQRRGAEGSPVRVALKAYGTFGIACPCPPLVALFPGAEDHEPLLTMLEAFDDASFLAIPTGPSTSPAPPLHGLRLGLVMVGYFSGATVSAADHMVATNTPFPSPWNTESYGWETREFCVESWCYALPRDYREPPVGKLEKLPFERFWDGVSRDQAAELRTLGAIKCKAGQW